ncbi:hypothetical protein AAFF_G00401980 [Aldrovandia affinis]|uniref:Uncharacterized protein n=1 Tax=Aldrovandia affinis TaxID=143900 RepID=A0AAD7T8N5_9TELE|nr:hypothetical protein AAFF_G00401980 [Aldrovandia affinis]
MDAVVLSLQDLIFYFRPGGGVEQEKQTKLRSLKNRPEPVPGGGILEVLYCVLIESPEVLNIIQENT